MLLSRILLLAQGAPPAPSSGLDASTIFVLSLLFIFVTAIVTAVATKWSRDKCLKFFNCYHVTLERSRGQTTWGQLKVFSSGIEIVYDHPYLDHRSQKKTSFMIYQQELDQQMLSLLRYHDELDSDAQSRRQRQVHKTFNPGPVKRLWRGVRNFVNTLRDAFNTAIGAAVGQYQRMNPANAIFTTQAGSVTQIGQTLLGKFANAFEPLPIGMVIPPNGTLNFPARDAHAGKLFVEIIRCLDVVAPRKYATVRHAGELVERRGLFDELEQGLVGVPLVPKLLGNGDRKESEGRDAGGD